MKGLGGYGEELGFVSGVAGATGDSERRKDMVQRFEQMPVAVMCQVACRGRDGDRGPGRRVHRIQGRQDGLGSRAGPWKWEKWSG